MIYEENHDLLRLQEEMDKLVDGELREEERYALLQKLDAMPDGWKLCSLNFLEAQSWAGAMSSVTDISSSRKWFAPLAVAAAAVLGFLLAWEMASSDQKIKMASVGGGVSQGQEGGLLLRSLSLDLESGENGDTYYVTRKEIPQGVLLGLQDSGHKVERILKTVSLKTLDGGEMKLPFTETRVFLPQIF